MQALARMKSADADRGPSLSWKKMSGFEVCLLPIDVREKVPGMAEFSLTISQPKSKSCFFSTRV